MVFWKTYPLENIILDKLNRQRFKPLVFHRQKTNSPTYIDRVILSNYEPCILNQLRLFLRTYFGNSPKKPIFDIPETELLGRKDTILFVKDIDRCIVGCIRYHYLGQLQTAINSVEEIYCVDCFCIHPKWRGKGVGDYLLNELHIYVNANNKPYSLFLKEGRILSIIHTPLYSGEYVCRELTNMPSLNTKTLTVEQAYACVNIFLQFNPSTFVLKNPEIRNQVWKLWSKAGHTILACFQDTHQYFEENGKKKTLGWITGWLESSNITDNIREEASIELSDSMSNNYDYIWTNKEWTGKFSSGDWKMDGSFHWYAYQWATSLSLNKSYILLN